MMRRTLLVLFWLSVPALLQGQSYMWPTDASRWLTSVFAESRPGHFHAGVDIKTWNRTGYKVFASRSGYVWRVRVSPFGYGKALYLKADTGEILVYAHLERFAPKIEKIVEERQERTGRYSLDRTFRPGALPVERGDVIAYTGQSGIGVPHLHFEIRDSRNRPTNPLLKNFDIQDREAPVIRAVGVLPLDSGSRVNGDVRPAVLRPKRLGRNRYVLETPLELFGNVVFAVSAWDRPGPIPNRTGVYELSLYIDDHLEFRTRYGTFDFADNRLIELDHNYLLSRRGFGKFYNLFRDPANHLSFYDPELPWAGVLSQKVLDDISLSTSPESVGAAAIGAPELDQTASPTAVLPDATSPGPHTFAIEVADFFGNRSRVLGRFFYGPKFRVDADLDVSASGVVRLRRMRVKPEVELTGLRVAVSTDRGESWKKLVELKAAALSGTDTDSADIVLGRLPLSSTASLLRLTAQSRDGVWSYPAFLPLAGAGMREVTLTTDPYPTYLRVEVASRGVPASQPRLIVHTEASRRRDVALHALAPDRFAGVLPLEPALQGMNHLEVVVAKSDKDSLVATDSIYLREVRPGQRSVVYSADGNCWVEYSPSSAYSTFYSRIEIEPDAVAADSDFASAIYNIQPQDEPLKSGGRVFIRYPSDRSPEKLGLYYQAEPGKWVFIDNQIDMARRTISARVLSLERFALLRDTTPPQISAVYPADGALVRSRRPRLRAGVKDERSGLADEERVFMLLDGRRVPAEYDPEADELRYRPRKALATGVHTLVILAEDRSGNSARYEGTFRIQ